MESNHDAIRALQSEARRLAGFLQLHELRFHRHSAKIQSGPNRKGFDSKREIEQLQERLKKAREMVLQFEARTGALEETIEKARELQSAKSGPPTPSPV
jgi:hypothetical protein